MPSDDVGWKRDLEIYGVLRAYARDERELVNQRLNWLGVSQSVLLTGYVALLTSIANNDVKTIVQNLSANTFGFHIDGVWALDCMFVAIAATGAMVCAITFLNVGWAYRSSDTINTRWREYLRNVSDERLRENLPFMEFGFDRLGDRPAPKWRLGVVLIPAVFWTVWFALAFFAILIVQTAIHR